jgi:threonine synthase
LGARVLAVRGSFDDALRASQELAARGDFALVNSVNEYRLEGQKTVAFEIIEELGRVPDLVALPYGGGGNTTAVFRGFRDAGEGLPRLMPSQAEHRATTVASAIRISDPVHADEVTEALEGCGGAIVTVPDADVIVAWQQLASLEGLFCEPSSAAGLAALKQEQVEAGTVVVCVITGPGLKDPDTAAAHSPPPIPVDPDPDAIARAAG